MSFDINTYVVERLEKIRVRRKLTITNFVMVTLIGTLPKLIITQFASLIFCVAVLTFSWILRWFQEVQKKKVQDQLFYNLSRQ